MTYRFGDNAAVTIKLKTWDKEPFDVKLVTVAYNAGLDLLDVENLCVGAVSFSKDKKFSKATAFIQQVKIFTEFSEGLNSDIIDAVNDVVVPFNRDHVKPQAVVVPAPTASTTKVVDENGVRLSAKIVTRQSV